MANRASIAQRVRELRTETGLSQTDFARELGISASYLCHVERGDRIPSHRFLDGVARIVGQSADEIADGTTFRPLVRGPRRLRAHAAFVRQVFPPPRADPPVRTIEAAFQLVNYFKSGPPLLDRVAAQRGRPPHFWRTLKRLVRGLNGAEQMVCLRVLDAGWHVEHMKPLKLGFLYRVVDEPGKVWAAFLLPMEHGAIALLPQLSVVTPKRHVYDLDFLAAVSHRGQRAFADIEVQGPVHDDREAEDDRRAAEIGLPTLRLPLGLLERKDFTDRLIRWCLAICERTAERRHSGPRLWVPDNCL